MPVYVLSTAIYKPIVNDLRKNHKRSIYNQVVLAKGKVVYIRLESIGMGISHSINSGGAKPITPAQLVEGIVGLVSLPEVCIRISEMVESPRYSASDIGKVISKDVALTARLLRIVNSAFYRFPSKIETVSRAITIVGNRELKDLVLAATIAGVFERISSDLISLDAFWRHGIYCGILSRLIAEKCNVLHSERLFAAGLMHDIGKLVICYKLPKVARQISILSIEDNISLHIAEQQMLGFNHADVGAELMNIWGFPSSHKMVAQYHHNPLDASEHSVEVSIVYLANIISHMAESGEINRGRINAIDKQIWRTTKVDKNKIETLLVDSREQFIEALSLFRPKGNNPSDFAA